MALSIVLENFDALVVKLPAAVSRELLISVCGKAPRRAVAHLSTTDHVDEAKTTYWELSRLVRLSCGAGVISTGLDAAF
jgi:hypothetical protein